MNINDNICCSQPLTTFTTVLYKYFYYSSTVDLPKT